MIADREMVVPMTLNVDEVWKVLKALKHNSGAGPSMLRPRYIRNCAQSTFGFMFALAFTAAVNRMKCDLSD